MAVEFIPAKEWRTASDKSYPLWDAGLDEMKGNKEGNQGLSERFIANLIFRPSLTTIPKIIRSTTSVISASELQN